MDLADSRELEHGTTISSTVPGTSVTNLSARELPFDAVNGKMPLPIAPIPSHNLRPRFQCIHPHCKKSFKDEAELKAHLIAYNPGMAAENQFLRDSCIALVSAIDSVRTTHPQTALLVRKYSC